MKMKKKKEKRKEIYNKKGNQEKHVPSCRRLDPTAPPSERTSPRPQDACQPVHGFGTLIRIALFSRWSVEEKREDMQTVSLKIA
jgi:hypothetical protein